MAPFNPTSMKTLIGISNHSILLLNKQYRLDKNILFLNELILNAFFTFCLEIHRSYTHIGGETINHYGKTICKIKAET